MISHTDKPWGYEELLEHNDHYVLKRIFMKEGHCCSLQYHKEKHETIYIVSGEMKFVHGDAEDALQTDVLVEGQFRAVPIYRNRVPKVLFGPLH